MHEKKTAKAEPAKDDSTAHITAFTKLNFSGSIYVLSGNRAPPITGKCPVIAKCAIISGKHKSTNKNVIYIFENFMLIYIAFLLTNSSENINGFVCELTIF